MIIINLIQIFGNNKSITNKISGNNKPNTNLCNHKDNLNQR